MRHSYLERKSDFLRLTSARASWLTSSLSISNEAHLSDTVLLNRGMNALWGREARALLDLVLLFGEGCGGAGSLGLKVE